MNFDRNLPASVQLAYEVIDLYEENARLRDALEELRGYRQKYMDELQNGINHSGHMIGMVIGALVDPESRLNRMLVLERKQ